ncbi:MAG: DUF1902 domain-containing protein [Methylococcaceae bacterium]
MYRLGRPFATLFSEMEMPLLIKVEIIHDDEANVYVATRSDLKGLVIEAETLDKLKKEVLKLAPQLLAFDNPKLHTKTAMHLSIIQLPITLERL